MGTEQSTNFRYFHIVATTRIRKNRIVCLKRNDGSFVHDPGEIERTFLEHFRVLFQCGDSNLDGGANGCDQGGAEPTLGCFKPLSVLGVRLTADQVCELDAPFRVQEVKEAVFQMGAMKAPSPDGYIAGFYQKSWEHIGDEVR